MRTKPYVADIRLVPQGDGQLMLHQVARSEAPTCLLSATADMQVTRVSDIGIPVYRFFRVTLIPPPSV